MQTVILIFLTVAAGICIAALLLVYRSIAVMAKSLRKINDADSNSGLKLPAPNRQLESLAVEINRTLSLKKEAESRYKRMDSRQRRDVANISHDLRTPLTSVIGYIQLLEDDSLTGEERSQYKEILLSRAKSLESMITGFYDLSRLESGDYRFEMEPVNLQNILCEILASFYQDFTTRGVEPKADIDAKASPAFADVNAVRRVFTNLIQNVLKHEGKNFSVALKQEDGEILTQFTNDAPQLSQEDTEHLFERFFTADRMRSGRNTGLGLAIVKELAEGMNGKIGAVLKNGRLCIEVRWRAIR